MMNRNSIRALVEWAIGRARYSLARAYAAFCARGYANMSCWTLTMGYSDRSHSTSVVSRKQQVNPSLDRTLGFFVSDQGAEWRLKMYFAILVNPLVCSAIALRFCSA